jgi:ParB/RepB/Spo0J family partition protein
MIEVERRAHDAPTEAATATSANALGQLRGELLTIPIAAIDRNPAQPRRIFDPTALQELGANIARTGLLQPIGVRPRDGGRYQLIWGERRLRAVEAAGGATISAQILDLDDSTALRATITENLVREQLTLEEQVEGFRVLMKEEGLSVAQAADLLGIQRQTIYRLLKIDEDPILGPAVLDGVMTKSQAQELLPIRDLGTKRLFVTAIQQRRAAGQAVPIPEIRQSVAAVKETERARARPAPPDYTRIFPATGAAGTNDPGRVGASSAPVAAPPPTPPAPEDSPESRQAMIVEVARRRARTQLRQAISYLRELAPIFASHAGDPVLGDDLDYLIAGLAATRRGEPWPEA